MSKKIVVTSECMTGLSERGADAKRGFGGDTLNTLVYIARQVSPAVLTVRYVTALGTDSLSQQVLDVWRGRNIDTSLTQQMENCLPGLYYIEADSTDECTPYYWRNGVAAKFWLESEQSVAICEELANFDYLYPSGISLTILSPTSREKLLSLLYECRANGGKMIFDNNYRPRLWASKEETRQVYQQMLERMNIAFLTLDDEDTLWGRQLVRGVIARIHSVGVKEVMVERGTDFCLVSIAGEGLVDVPAVKLSKEKVVGTTATSDSFSAGYLTVYLTGGSAEDAVKCGHLTVSAVTQYRGAIISREAMLA